MKLRTTLTTTAAAVILGTSVGVAAPASATTTGPATTGCYYGTLTQSFQSVEAYSFNQGLTLASPVYDTSGVRWAFTSKGTVVVANESPDCRGIVLPTTGAHYGMTPWDVREVSGTPVSSVVVKRVGAIGTHYLASDGGDRYGLPTTASTAAGAGWFQSFAKNIDLAYSPATGLDAVKNGIRAKHRAEGGYTGWLGYPKTAERTLANGTIRQDFTGGYVLWSASAGAKAYRY